VTQERRTRPGVSDRKVAGEAEPRDFSVPSEGDRKETSLQIAEKGDGAGQGVPHSGGSRCSQALEGAIANEKASSETKRGKIKASGRSVISLSRNKLLTYSRRRGGESRHQEGIKRLGERAANATQKC